MIRNKIICLIPAKKNSSLKNKNMLRIKKKPLVYYTIINALKSKYIDEINLSSDSKNILNYSKKFNVNVIKRPKRFARKSSKASEVILHFIRSIKKGLNNKSIIYLQPTSPLRNYLHINKAIKMHFKNNHKAVISFKKSDNKILKNFLIKNNSLFPLENGKYTGENRQNLPKILAPNGAIYIFSIKEFMKEKKIPYKKSIPMIMKSNESIDLDTSQDLAQIKRLLIKNVKKI